MIVEGNYLLLGDGAWKEVSSMFDEKWYDDLSDPCFSLTTGKKYL